MPKSDQKPTPAVDKRLVLVVEDELINREILGMMLQDTYKLLFAETGAQALELLDTYCSTLSIVLLDLNLPDMRGMDILRGMKQSDRTALIPVIVMTADEESEVECLILGATDFIAKPYPKQEIVLARIHRTIELFEDRDIIRWTECDHLTGLYNREFFYRYAAQYDIHHPDVPTDAIVLDVNHFHMINERYGRAVGDEVLKAIAEQLQLMADESGGIACHLEADAFMAYCPHRSDYNDFLQAVCVKAGDGHRVRVRMGVYSNVDRDVDIERRFDRAKQAADTVRNSYTPAIGAYDISMHEKELYHEQLLEDFHAAINEGQFTVYYQPKFDVRTPEPTLSSSEALVRWFHPSLGMVSPAVFIPLFEGDRKSVV